MTRANPRLGLAALACAGLLLALGPSAAAAQDLPPDVQADLYMLRAERHIESEEWGPALEALDAALALRAANDMEIPAALWLRHAQVALNADSPRTAVASATRYLQETGRRGEDYEAALALLDEAQSRVETAPAPPPPPPDPAPAAAPAPATALAPAAAGRLTVHFPMIGMSAATMAFGGGALAVDASSRTGVAGGVAVGFPSPVGGDRLGIRIGARYAQKGAGLALAAGGASVSADVSFESVDLAALARVSALQAANLSLYGLVGPYASLEVDCRFVVDAVAGMGSFSPGGDCGDAGLDTQSVDFGVSGGAGFEIGLGASRVSIDVLYSHGLQDIDRAAGGTARHRVLSVLAGVATTF